MNETRGNARTKPMRGGLKGGEINSLKDSEKTNENKVIKIKLTIQEIQALAIICADIWIYKPKFVYIEQLTNEGIIWKKLSEKLFAIYRINK